MLAPGVREQFGMTERDVLEGWQARKPEYGEFMWAAVADAFERTTTSSVMTEGKVQEAEEAAYGENAPSRYAVTDSAIGFSPELAGLPNNNTHMEKGWTQAEYKASPHFREKVQWQDGWTEARAKIYAEDYDKREARQMLLASGGRNYGFTAGTVAPFFAGVLGSLPDPINIVPVAGMGASKTVLQGLMRGAAEGAISNATIDALVLPDLKRRGADVGFADLALDIAFGAVIGGAFGSLGGFMGSRRQARAEGALARLVAEAQGTMEHHVNTHGEFALHDSFLDGARPVGEELSAHSPAPFDAVPDSFLQRNGANDLARMTLPRQERQAMLGAMELAVDAVGEGRPVDVGNVLREGRALESLYSQALFNPLYASDPHSPQVRLLYADLARDLQVQLGDIFVDIGHADINSAGQVEVQSGFGMVKFVWKHGEQSSNRVSRQITKQDILKFPSIVQEYMPRPNEQGGYKWVVPGENGKAILYVAKNFRETTGQSHLVTVHVLKSSKVEAHGLSHKIADLASSERGFAPLSEIPHGELTNTMGGEALPANAVSRPSVGQESANQLGRQNIGSAEPVVNRFAVAAPEEFSPAPLPDATRSAFDDLGRDRETGLMPEELQVREMAEQGRVLPEEAASMVEAEAAEARVAQLEEAGFGVMDCIWKVVD